VVNRSFVELRLGLGGSVVRRRREIKIRDKNSEEVRVELSG